MTTRALTALALSASLTAQSFAYTDFSTVTSLNLLGNAAQSGTALRLTANASNQTGWAWHRTAMPVIAGFDTTFTFRITPPAVGTKAEGMALVIHDDPNGIATTGGTVWGMGYGTGANTAVGIRNSIAIELDTYLDGFLGDTSANELTIHTRGSLGNNENEQYSIARATPTQNLSNAQVHTLRVRYVPGTIEVYVDNAATPSITRAYSLLTGGLYASGAAAPAPTLASGTAFLGFCATTGAGTLTELVEILSWSWTSTSLVDACYAGAQGADVLRINGQSGGPLRTLTLPTYQPFSIDMLSPSPYGNGAPWILLGSLFPNPGSPAALSPFGPMCMEVAPFGIGTLILADAFSSPNPYLPAGPTPYSIQLPVGAVPFVLDITLQGIVATSASPLTFGVTNAIDVDFRNAPAPTITSVAPLSAQPGQTVQIAGTGFLNGATLAVNGVPVPTITRTATAITFAYPAGVPCGSSLQVQNIDGQSATSALNPNPVVTSTALSSGTAAGGQLFLISGQGFSQGTTVTVGGAAATIQSVSATSVLVRTPAGTPGVAPVVVTTPGGCVVNTTYTYT